MGTINAVLGVLLLSAAAAADLSDNPLVDAASVVGDAVIDVRYAGPDNFVGEPLYPRPAVYLRRSTAQKLARAAEELRAEGLRLVLYDGYRPLSVQRRMWAKLPDRRFVAPPERGSLHNRGAAVDCGLADRDGRPLEMPSAFDEFGPLAAHDAPGATPAARRNARRLRRAMERAGFNGIQSEWWHYGDPDGAGWPLLDVPLSALGSP